MKIKEIDQDINYLEHKIRVSLQDKYSDKNIQSRHRLIKQVELLKTIKQIYKKLK